MIADRSGVLSIPVKLMVCFLVIGLMTPILMDCVKTADEEIAVSGIRSEAIGLKDGITDAYYKGGTTVFVDVSLEPGHALIVGGDGIDGYAIRLAIDGEVVDRLYLESPSVRVLGGELTIEGDAVVKAALCRGEDGSYGVKVEL